MQERGVARLWEVARSSSQLYRSLQMNAEAASDVDPKY